MALVRTRKTEVWMPQMTQMDNTMNTDGNHVVWGTAAASSANKPSFFSAVICDIRSLLCVICGSRTLRGLISSQCQMSVFQALRPVFLGLLIALTLEESRERVTFSPSKENQE